MGNFNDFTAHGYEVIKELGANRGAGRIAYLARELDSEQLVVIKQFQFAQGSGWDGHKEIDGICRDFGFYATRTAISTV